MTNRNTWEYRGCEVVPESGPSRYFGHVNFQPDRGQPQYFTNWWRVKFPDGTYCLCSTKESVREYVDMIGCRHGCAVSVPQSQAA